MCNLSQTVKEEGCQEGLIDGILLSLKNLMKNKGVPVEEAFATLEVPEADWQEYRKLLAGQ